ncbi:MAG: polysaccharide deacetylase family protein [Oscillospiraceae bacterium]
MNFKKIIALSLIVIMSLGIFTACSSRDKTDEQTPPEINNDQIPEQPPRKDTPPEAQPETEESQRTAPALSTDFSQIGDIDPNILNWGPGGPVDEKNRSNGAVAYQEKYGKYNADFIAPDNNKIYLTFDEGYENGYTGAILDVLKDKNCPAVFFVTLPYAKSEDDLVKRMIDEGHTVGNHSSTHPVMPSISNDKQAEEILTLHNYIKETYDYDMNLFRYPEGSFSEQSLALVQEMGYRSVFWSFAYKDWIVDAQPNPSDALQTLDKKLHPGAIYLLHAVSKTNTEILGSFIDYAREQGYEFASYDELTA